MESAALLSLSCFSWPLSLPTNTHNPPPPGPSGLIQGDKCSSLKCTVVEMTSVAYWAFWAQWQRWSIPWWNFPMELVFLAWPENLQGKLTINTQLRRRQAMTLYRNLRSVWMYLQGERTQLLECIVYGGRWTAHVWLGLRDGVHSRSSRDGGKGGSQPRASWF